jgi:hypothetical protein
VQTVSSRFGAIPRSLPSPALPTFSIEKVQAVLPDGIAIALLGAIESLLSAVVADGMTGRRHRSNCELSAQGLANIGSILFGGICVTGTVARTATNVRAGARGPISGILHCGYLLVFLIVAAPLVGFIPLAALAAVLAVVAWNMAEKEQFWPLLRSSGGDAVVLLSTFLLTIFVDLVTGIAVGVSGTRTDGARAFGTDPPCFGAKFRGRPIDRQHRRAFSDGVRQQAQTIWYQSDICRRSATRATCSHSSRIEAASCPLYSAIQRSLDRIAVTGSMRFGPIPDIRRQWRTPTFCHCVPQ